MQDMMPYYRLMLMYCCLSRLKTYVGNALDTASRGPAWLASKAVPVAADGAGLFRNAAADAADRVALFRRRYRNLHSQMLAASCPVWIELCCLSLAFLVLANVPTYTWKGSKLSMPLLGKGQRQFVQKKIILGKNQGSG